MTSYAASSRNMTICRQMDHLVEEMGHTSFTRQEKLTIYAWKYCLNGNQRKKWLLGTLFMVVFHSDRM